MRVRRVGDFTGTSLSGVIYPLCSTSFRVALMSTEEVSAYVGFDKGNRLPVVETPDQIKAAIATLPPDEVPLLTLTRRNGIQYL